MLFATVGQGALFVWMMLCGVVIGVWYALMALLRRILQAGFWLTLACDLAFGFGCAVILLGFMVLGNYGQFRLYMLLGAVAGIILFAFALASPLCRLLTWMKEAGGRIWAKITKNRLIKVIFR